MKTRLFPVLMAAVLTATAVQASSNDDDAQRPPERERERERAGRPQAPAPQQKPPQQQQAQPRPQSQSQSQSQQAQAQAQPQERGRPGAAATPPRGWIPGDPNHPSAPRGNPSAGNQGSQRGAQPMASAPNVGGNGAQGSGQRAGQPAGPRADDRSGHGNRSQYANQNPSWQADRSRGSNRSGPPNANPQRTWRDSQGHDWRANRGWYDRYRSDHFRYSGGRYFARQRYSLGGYAWPRGYASRLWRAGEWLPSVFFIDGRYDLNDYWSYNLYEPPLGCLWIRVGSDALLIDEMTGEVLDVVYDLFW